MRERRDCQGRGAVEVIGHVALPEMRRGPAGHRCGMSALRRHRRQVPGAGQTSPARRQSGPGPGAGPGPGTTRRVHSAPRRRIGDVDGGGRRPGNLSPAPRLLDDDLVPDGVSAERVNGSFLHLPNLVFHEAGHILFLPLGRFMTVLGGSLTQVLVPLVCAGAFLWQTRDAFGAAVGRLVGRREPDRRGPLYQRRA